MALDIPMYLEGYKACGEPTDLDEMLYPGAGTCFFNAGLRCREKEFMSIPEKVASETLPGYLASKIPDYVSDVRREVDRGNPEWLTATALLRDVFLYGAFRSAVLAGDEEMVVLCYAIVEDLLASPDELLRPAAIDGIVSAVLSTDSWARSAQQHGGPRLLSELDESTGGPWWRTQKDGFGDDYPPPAARQLHLAAYLYQDGIFLHARQEVPDGTYSTTLPFAKVASIDTPSLGGTVAGMLLELKETPPPAARHLVDEFLEFVGVADWLTFYTASVSVDISATVATFEAQVWPRVKDLGGSVARRPGAPLKIQDWRDSDALGLALRTAFSTSTVTG
ncbi:MULTISPECIES: hypothetical protein [Kribbella]|uniref:hypothetical protein n=1 Tax=Kribbella TaxID=182639 RepID=UPI00104EE4D9|nr:MULTISPECIES: hypothetical protein [Kribbella]